MGVHDSNAPTLRCQRAVEKRSKSGTISYKDGGAELMRRVERPAASAGNGPTARSVAALRTNAALARCAPAASWRAAVVELHALPMRAAFTFASRHSGIVSGPIGIELYTMAMVGVCPGYEQFTTPQVQGND